ncbi:MAG: metabolite traffic protein EboE [Opitutaceae bacterium]|nr:metabolite traffic protein EboE [Opitutaceae bacterium]
MKLNHGLHLAYCTNVHRGENWAETFTALERHVLPVRRRVAPGRACAIGLRLGQRAASELAQPAALLAFQLWLEKHDCYIFTINGFPYGSFHGTRVKEQVYAPDWSTPERLAYTRQLFELLVQIAPPGEACSVSTVPASFKAFVAAEPARRAAIFANLTACGRHLAELAEKTGRDLHLGLEPEPLCLIETSEETVAFFNAWRASDHAIDRDSLLCHIGVNYDCCHLAVEFESAPVALDRITAAGLRLSKLHLSSALRVRPDAAGRAALAAFVEPVYLHQVVVGHGHEVRRRFVDLPEALADGAPNAAGDEWRIHFHVPLHAAPGAPFADTRDHLVGALDWLANHPGACTHLEMETYTWEVLPPAMRLPIEDQLVREYGWTLEALAQRGLADPALAACARELTV